jgi:hypothetical protein
MEILRVPPYPITVTWNLPSPNTSYTMYIEDLVDHSIETQEITSSSTGSFSYVLPPSKTEFDDDFLVRFYDGEDVVLESNLEIIRPYINPSDLGTTATEIAEYKKWELIARSLIDTYAGSEFYNKKTYMQTSGSGADYIPLWKKVNKVLKVYENDLLIYDLSDVKISIEDFDTTSSGTLITTLIENGYVLGDTVTLYGFTDDKYNGNYKVLEIISPTQFRIDTLPVPVLNNLETVKRFWASEFKVTLDKTAIYRVEVDAANRISYPTIKLPAASGDIATAIYNYGTFPPGYDYIFVLDEGFKTVPSDIRYAAEILVDDLKCGRLDYYKRYVTSYNTDQFKIQFDKQSLEGTGNIMVDKILDKYMKSITKVGVL